MKALIGRKLGMTQIIDQDGNVVPVTLVQAGPCTVTQIKTDESDGYSAIQVGFESTKRNNKALTGHLKAAKADSKVLGEFRVAESDLKVGDTLDVAGFEVGDKVDVQSNSKGKGFAGNVKRHNFNTSKKTHGGKGNVRRPGSIGSMYPQKVWKGKRMAGQLGAATTTVRNQQVAFIDKANNLLGIRGTVPGARKSIVRIKAVN